MATAAMALPNPTVLTGATRFRPTNVRSHSRSPSRSPVRTAQFRAQHLDPLLRNLSPESTFKALQATETVQQGSAQDVLTKSIADASPSEREIGIRAAFAGQQLRGWRSEISHWQWPSRKDRALGAGFLPPQDQVQAESDGSQRVYLGYLPLSLVDLYEQRIDEIRDALESLDIDDIKDHVLAAHSTSPGNQISSPKTSRLGLRTSSYGRMRDFTALITATVIQALPDLAILTALLDTWEVRLKILRQLPMVLEAMESTGRGVLAATTSTKYPQEAALLNQQDFDETKSLLGTRVSELGSRIDAFLDLLEGQEDALPQTWIDSLENLELVYAKWAVDAQRAVTQNEARDRQDSADLPKEIPSVAHQGAEGVAPTQTPLSSPDSQPLAATAPDSLPRDRDSPQKEAIDHQQLAEARSKIPPPPLNLGVPGHHGHRREQSEVSIADSAYSAMSGLSEAEIAEARQTQVLPSPKVSMIDNPFAPTKEDLSFFGSKEEALNRPPMVQRASTASFEVIPKEQLKKVDLRRSMSADLMAKMSHTDSIESTPSKALEQLSGRPPTGTTPVAELEDPTSSSDMLAGSNASSLFPSPPLAVQPLRISTRNMNSDYADSPVSPISPQLPTVPLPRRSSKRKSLPASLALSQLTPITSIDSDMNSASKAPTENGLSRDHHTSLKKSTGKGESLESKIHDILATLPTKIRLTDDSGPQSVEDTSASSTRASTPTPALTLSPAKQTRSRSVADTDVRVFHLHQHGQSRESAPIKLFVRAVGENGERVMVRVGGGWADLGEYLKEYSAHHRSRSIAEGTLEVAEYPGKSKRDSAAPSATLSSDPSRRISGGLAKAIRRRSASQTSIDSARGGKGGSSRSPSPPPGNGEERTSWTMPPVPPIPAPYSVSGPKVTVISHTNGTVETKVDGQDTPNVRSPTGLTGSSQPPTVRSSTMTAPGVTTTTTSSILPPTSNGKYTPLGAAGPISSARRSVTLGSLPTNSNSDAWVQGMVGKARAVSGATVTHGPTVTTTTTTTATNSTPPSRRASVMFSLSPKNGSPASSNKGDKSLERGKSRMSFADVSGIKRVFLRRKSEK